MNRIMNTDDAVLAKEAEVFVTIKNRRYSMLMCKKFEGKVSVSSQDVPRLGSIIVGKRPTSAQISFSMTIYKCTAIFDEVVEEFIKTGVMPRIDIQVTNDDQAASPGRNTVIYNNCTLDGDVLLSLADSGEDFIEQEISGFADSITHPEKFKNPAYMANG